VAVCNFIGSPYVTLTSLFCISPAFFLFITSLVSCRSFYACICSFSPNRLPESCDLIRPFPTCEAIKYKLNTRISRTSASFSVDCVLYGCLTLLSTAQCCSWRFLRVYLVRFTAPNALVRSFDIPSVFSNDTPSSPRNLAWKKKRITWSQISYNWQLLQHRCCRFSCRRRLM